jgi:hypothetical protein
VTVKKGEEETSRETLLQTLVSFLLELDGNDPGRKISNFNLKKLFVKILNFSKY